MTRIRAVGVVIPAHDEEHHVRACLRSVRRALGELPPGIATAVTVALDRCRDRTPQRVAAELDGWDGAAMLHVAAAGGHRGGHGSAARAGVADVTGPLHIVAGSGVGAIRDLGVRHTLERLRPYPPAAIWLLNTDADTTVPHDWARDHLSRAAAGAVGVAGPADLDEPDGLSPDAGRRYRALVHAGIDGDRHRHVYGANLGVRADAYLECGGFPVHGSGEDHALWRTLGEAGHRLDQPLTPSVRTSARLHGRAAGGLADLLHRLHRPAPGDETYAEAPPAG